MKRFYGKEIIEPNKSGFHSETPYYTDMRAIFLANFLDKKIESMEVESQLKGIFRYYYKKTSFVRKALAILLFFIIFLQKPAWCQKLGDQVSEDCSQGQNGQQFFLLNPLFIEGTNITVLLFTIMYFLLSFQALKIHYSDKIVRSELVKFNLLLGFFCTSLLINILELTSLLPLTNLSTIFNILFVFFYFKTVVRAVTFFAKMMSFSWEVLLLWFVNVLVFALIARIAFEDVDIGSASYLQGYSFRTYHDSLNSIISLMFLGSFKEILVDAHAKSPLSILIFGPFVLLTVVMIGFSLHGNYYFHFKMCYIEVLNRIYTKYPEFRVKILPLVKEKFLHPKKDKQSMTALAFIVKEKHANIRKDDLNSERKKTNLDKFRGVVQKIKFMKMFKIKTPLNSFRATYLQAKSSFAFKLLDFVLAFYVFALPIISLSDEQGLSIPENVQMSEMLGTFYLVDFIVNARFSMTEHFWSPIKIIDLISSVGMIFFSHVLYLYPLDYRSSDLISSTFLFNSWAIFNILKILRIHKICMNSIDYKIIIKTVLHILPMLTEFLWLYFLLVMIFGTVSFAILGGTYDTQFLEMYKQATGNELRAVYSFNDLISSVVGFTFFNIGGGYSDIGLPAIVAFSKISQNSLLSVCLMLFFYVYWIFSELMIVNLIIGLTMDFIFAYGDNNAHLILQNRQFTNNTNIIERFLGFKTLENTLNQKNGITVGKNESIRNLENDINQIYRREDDLSMELSKDFESNDEVPEK